MLNKHEDMMVELNADAIEAVSGAGVISVQCTWGKDFIRCTISY